MEPFGVVGHVPHHMLQAAQVGQLGGDIPAPHLVRRGAIDVDLENRHISIFGGKLTDCLNVGNEIVADIQEIGVAVPFPHHGWYGEPGDQVKEEYLHQAELMDLDALTDPSSSEPLTQRLWRRYGSQAIGLLERIRCDPKEAELLIKRAEYLRCEIEQAARREMITKLEEFLRRRSKISLVVRRQELLDAPGVKEACRIFFGDQAAVKYDEYFRENP